MLTSEQRRLGTGVTIEDLEESMNQYWRQVMCKGDGESEEDEDELNLSAFTGICFKCDKKGHKAFNCDKHGREYRKCYHCGKPGHLAYDCWEKEENKDK